MVTRGRIPTIDYSSRDFEAIKDDMIATIPFFLPEWTQHNENDFGIALIRLFSMMGDVLHYYIDRVHNESYLPTLIKRESAINILNLIDYQMSRPSAATVDMVFALASVQTEDTVVAQGTQLLTNPLFEGDTGILFETLDDLIIRAGTLGNESIAAVVQEYNDLPTDTSLPDAEDSLEVNTVYFVVAEDAYYRVNNTGNWELLNVTPPDSVSVGDYVYSVSAEEGLSKVYTFPAVSQSEAFLRFRIPETGIIQDSTKSYVDEGGGFNEWPIIQSWLEADFDDKNTVLYTDADGNVDLEFGNNIQGKQLNAGNVVRATYRVGGGEEGNVGAHTIVNINTPQSIYWVIDYNTKVVAGCTNPLQASGGADEESIDEARRKGPQSLRTLYRAVTAEDFKTICESVPGVSRCAVIQGGQIESCGFCAITLAVYPEGGGPLSSELEQRILNEIEEKRMVCTSVVIQRADDVEINMKGSVYGYVNYLQEDVENNLADAIELYFEETRVNADLTQPVYLSDVMAMLDGVEGVDHVDLTEITRKPNPTYRINSGGWTVTGFEVGKDSVDETFTCTFINKDEFKVTGSETGDHANGTIDVPYSSDNEEISFVVNSGEQDAAQGDEFSFVTSPKIGNISTTGAEIPVEGDIELEVIIPEEGGRTSGPCG